MSFTYEQHLALKLASNDDQSHGLQMRENWAAMAAVASPRSSFFVSPDYTTANLFNETATDRRHFPTVQEAVTAAQSSSYSSRATVFIYPGYYPENVVITDTITLAAKVPPMFEGLGGGINVFITGVTTYAGPVVRITPNGTGITAVNLINVCLTNYYNQNNATEITEAYAIEIDRPATYDSKTYIGFKNCQMKLQTYGDHNLWSYGIRGAGYAQIVMDGCDLKAWGYSGGENDGGIRRLISLNGDSANGKNFNIYARNCNFYNDYQGSALHFPSIFDIENGVTGIIGRSGWDRGGSVHLLGTGGTGTNYLSGLTGSEPAEYGNTPGVCLSWL